MRALCASGSCRHNGICLGPQAIAVNGAFFVLAEHQSNDDYTSAHKQSYNQRPIAVCRYFTLPPFGANQIPRQIPAQCTSPHSSSPSLSPRAPPNATHGAAVRAATLEDDRQATVAADHLATAARPSRRRSARRVPCANLQLRRSVRRSRRRHIQWFRLLLRG